MGPIDLDTHSAPLNEGPTADLEGKSRRRIATFFDGSYVADPNDYQQITDERPAIQHARSPSVGVADIDIDTVRDFVPIIDEDEVKPQPIGPTHSMTTVSFVIIETGRPIRHCLLGLLRQAEVQRGYVA